MAKKMGTQQGLLIRGKTYYFQTRIPADCLPYFPEGTKPLIRERLSTTTLITSKAVVQQKLAELSEKIHRIRTTGNPNKVSITDAEVDHLIRAALHSRLQADENIREAGLDDHMWERLQGWQGEADEREKLAIARGELSEAAIEVAQDWLRGYGYDITPDSPEFRTFAIRFHKALSQASTISNARDKGKWIDTPSAPQPLKTELAAKADDTLEALRDYWLTQPAKNGGQKSRTSIAEAETMIRKFRLMVGDLRPSQVEKKHVVLLKDKMLEAGSSPATINKGRGILAAIFSCAHENQKLEKNPFDGMKKLPVAPSEQEKPYSIEELQIIFNSSIFTKGERPKQGKGEAAFWLPLLGLYTGARLNELGQLYVEDVGDKDGIPFLKIRPDSATGRTVKDKSSRRIPIHPDLIAMGFLDYVEKTREIKATQLFPLLKTTRSDGKLADKWATWWSGYVRHTLGITRVPKPFHGLRHSFSEFGRECGMEYEHRMRIEGHSLNTVGDRHYGGSLFPLEPLNEAIKKLNYRGLDLSGVSAMAISPTPFQPPIRLRIGRGPRSTDNRTGKWPLHQD